MGLILHIVRTMDQKWRNVVPCNAIFALGYRSDMLVLVIFFFSFLDSLHHSCELPIISYDVSHKFGPTLLTNLIKLKLWNIVHRKRFRRGTVKNAFQC